MFVEIVSVSLESTSVCSTRCLLSVE